MREKLKKLKFLKNIWVVFGLGILLGVLVLLTIRFFTYSPERVHYHANFAVYINGQREQFKNPLYYQEVAICAKDRGITTPQQRAHMHDEENGVIHVHDHSVTWGQFFENIGWYIGPDFIENADGTMYRNDGDSKLHLMINGQDFTDLTAITNTVIKDRDRLLVSFGNISDDTLNTEFKSVPNTAKQHDESKDPAACAGAEAVTTQERFHHLF